MLRLALVFAVVLNLLLANTLSAYASDDKWYLTEIERVKQEEMQYHLKEFKKLDSKGKLSYTKQFGFKATDIDGFTKDMAKALDAAYIYVMDESGNIYGRSGYLTTLDISGNSASTLAQSVNSINGANTGAFCRQTTKEGYRGIRMEFRLPTSSKSEIAGPGTPFLYSGVHYLRPGQSGYFDMEGGLQYSLTYNNYSAYIRVNGASQRFEDDSRLGTGTYPPRFKADTSFVQNLRYEPENSKVKYYASGTNVNNQSQLLVFSHSKSFTSTQQNQLRVRRVTGIAYDDYDGTQKIGKVDVQYTNSTFLTSSGSTVNMDTSRLDTWEYGGIIYGTVDWPEAKITKSPSTGSIVSQRIIVNTN